MKSEHIQIESNIDLLKNMNQNFQTIIKNLQQSAERNSEINSSNLDSQRNKSENSLLLSEYDSQISSDISIDQQILQQHEEVVSKAINDLQKGLKHCYIEEGLIYKKIEYHKSVIKQVSFQNYMKNLIISLDRQNKDVVSHFKEYLNQQKQFAQFMRYIYYSHNQLISMQTIRLIYIIWKFYCPYIRLSLSLTEINLVALNISKKLYSMQNLWIHKFDRITNLQNGYHDLKQQFQMILTKTTIYVLQKIFKNPYYNHQNIKKQFEENQTLLEKNFINGSKKIKRET